MNDNVRVTILEIGRHQVCLGIETPDQAPYYREEVLFVDDDGDMLAETNEAQPVAEPLVPATAL